MSCGLCVVVLAVSGRQEAELGFGPLGQCLQPFPKESDTVCPLASRDWLGVRPGVSGTLVAHWLGDSSAAGLPSTTPTPTPPFFIFFLQRKEAMTVSFFLQSREVLRQLQKTCLLTPSHLLPAPMSASLVSAAQVWAPCDAN